MLNISLNEDGQAPAIGQFTQMTMQPHTDMLRALAARMSGATGVPLSQFGVMTDSGPSSSDAIMRRKANLSSSEERLPRHRSATAQGR